MRKLKEPSDENQTGCRQCKTNTLTILMHQMRISTTKVSSVMLRSKKLESEDKNEKIERAVG